MKNNMATTTVTAPYITKPHDKGYKKSLSNPKEFLHFLKKYVNAEWTTQLTVSQLRLCDKEFIDNDYEGKSADLIYEITKDNGEQIYAFILQELQSTVDYTMIFRIVIYIINNLLRYFLSVAKNIREREDFKLPAMIPIVFYNGEKTWSAVQSMQEYQQNGSQYGEYIINLKYYLIDLSKVDEKYILYTNTVLDNIMYCDKFRKKIELLNAVQKAYDRIQHLSLQEQESFDNWVRHILLTLCGNNATAVEEIITLTKKGEHSMAFQYNAIAGYEEEKRELMEQSKSLGVSLGIKLAQLMINNGESSLIAQLGNEDFRKEMCQKYQIM